MSSAKYSKFMLVAVLTIMAISSQMVSSDPGQEDLEKWPLLREAALEQKKGNFRNALKLYRHAYDNNMARAAIVPNIVNCHTKLEQKPEAMAFLVVAVKENPFDRELRILLSDKYVEFGENEKALQELDYADKLSQKDFRPSLKRAHIYKALTQYEPAIRNYTAYIENTKPPGFEPYLRRSQSLAALGRMDLAEKDIKRAHEAKPFEVETLVTYIGILQTMKKFNEAEPFARQCTEVDPKSMKCWDLRGDVNFAAGKHGPAVDHFAAASKLAPENYELSAKLARTLVLLNRLPEADIQFARVLKLKPDHSEALRGWVPTLLKRQDYAGAAEVLKTFHSQTPRDLWAAAEYGKLMSFVGSHDVALATMKNHIRAVKSDAARMYMAQFYYTAGEYGRALGELENLTDPTLATDFNMGLVFFKLKKWEKGIQKFEQVKSEAPYYNKARFNSALGLELAGNIPAAIERANSITAPPEVKKKVTTYIQYLNESQNRAPADASARPVNDFESYLDWEQPTI